MIKNRIIGLEYMPANELIANPLNARTHPARQREALRGSLSSLGYYDAVILNKHTGYLIDGHARVEEQLTLDETAKMPVLLVDLDEQEEAQALASHDWISSLAEYDKAILTDLMSNINTDDNRVAEMLSEMSKELSIAEELTQEPAYTHKIEIPHYTPTQEHQPAITSLYDDSKTQELIREINNANLSDELKLFLTLASYRHTVFNFSQIAEYYAHCDEQTQSLFEQNALVIIDFNDAIAKGFVKLTESIKEQYKGDHYES